MSCEICGAPTSASLGSEPAEERDNYFTMVETDEQAHADGVLGTNEYEFCSIDHLTVFARDASDVGVPEEDE